MVGPRLVGLQGPCNAETKTQDFTRAKHVSCVLPPEPHPQPGNCFSYLGAVLETPNQGAEEPGPEGDL